MNTGPPMLRKRAEEERRPCMCIDVAVVSQAGHASLRVDRCGQEGKTGGLPSTPSAKMCCIL